MRLELFNGRYCVKFGSSLHYNYRIIVPFFTHTHRLSPALLLADMLHGSYMGEVVTASYN